MCQLFGVSSAQRIEVNAYLREFASHSMEHPHGWGLATFYGDAVNLEKEPLPAWHSSYLQSRLRFPIRVQSMIAHIRNASVGVMSYENCHPFVARDRSGRTWALAHNGTIFQSPLLEGYVAEQLGNTDSERIMLHLLHRINARLEQAGRPLTDEDRFQEAEQTVLDIAEHNQVNLLFYDGALLYVHTNQKNKLYYKNEDGALLFATVPLDQDPWEPVTFARLLAYQDGRLVREGTPHTYEYLKGEETEHLIDSSFL